MAAFSRPLTIRQANIDDFINMGKRLHGARRSQIYNTLYGTADPDFWQQRYWMDSAGGGVGKGQHNVLFLERADTKEIIGLAWFWRIDRECEPIHSGWSSKGFCNDEAWKVTLPQFFWQRELMATRHQYICELGYRTRSEIVDLPPVDPESPVSLTDLQEFAISPAYRNRGLEKVLLGHIIALAEENRLDLALTVAQGKPSAFPGRIASSFRVRFSLDTSEKSGFFFQEGWTFVHSERISSRCKCQIPRIILLYR